MWLDKDATTAIPKLVAPVNVTGDFKPDETILSDIVGEYAQLFQISFKGKKGDILKHFRVEV